MKGRTPPSIDADPSAHLLHRLVDAQTARTPGAIAVTRGGDDVTYADLSRRADSFATRLVGLGVGPDVTVAVSIWPSINLIVALIAVLKAGGAYVPINPTTPAARRRQLLADTRPAVVVDDQADGRLRILPLLAAETSASTANGPLRPDNLAYVIFTSGSTGQPKGVMVTHRSICNTLVWRQREYPLGSDDRVLFSLDYSFDASIFQIFQPLISGATVVVPRRGLDGSPHRIVLAVRESTATVLGVVPSSLAEIVHDPEFAECTSLDVIYSGGESLSSALLADVNDALPQVRVVNVYGPTEASMEATSAVCAPDEPIRLGTPVAGMRVYVLDERLRTVTSGRVGELYLAGVGLARGYLNSPGLTATRFLPDAFGAHGQRMYRTGDRCRVTADGDLEYVGRLDRQVKLRGQRLELGEIESALESHPAVVRCVADVRNGQAAGPSVVAYVKYATGRAATTAELSAHAATRLPRYMLPSAYLPIGHLPLMASGKTDRRALEAPGDARSKAPGRLPKSPIERWLADQWSELLGCDGIRLDDNFFELGGSSLQAAMLADRMERRLGRFVYSPMIYDRPTFRELASFLESSLAQPRRSNAADPPTPQDFRDFEAALADAADTTMPATASGLAPAIFVLSAPRSGSTLLRAMLGSHPRLFAPPELQLLNFSSLASRRAAFSGRRDRFWLQGTTRALMELRGCSQEDAEAMMLDYETREFDVGDFYRAMQRDLGDRILVDKTPTYALHRSTLDHAQRLFDEPRYLHLVRHPADCIASFREASLHVFFRAFVGGRFDIDHSGLAEMVWTLSHRNILGFLDEVPAGNQLAVRFEELIRDPDRVLRTVSAFIGVEYDPAMANPYAMDQHELMMDPVHPLARMLGDVKYAGHDRVRPERAEPAEARRDVSTLSRRTRNVAQRLGYTIDMPAGNLVQLCAHGTGADLTFVHAAAGGIATYQTLARRLLGIERFSCFHMSAETTGGSPLVSSLEELATSYVHELRLADGAGTYRLGGWSFGGLVALEMALQLSRLGDSIEVVVLLGSHLPGPEGQQRRPPDRREALLELAFEYGVAADEDDGERRDGRTLVAEAFASGQASGVVPQGMTLRQFGREMVGRANRFRSNIELARKYRPRGMVERILLIDGGPAATVERERNRWRPYARTVEAHSVGPDHYAMLHDPYVSEVARLIERQILPTSADPPGLAEAVRTARRSDERP